jgi:hypothetical protein
MNIGKKIFVARRYNDKMGFEKMIAAGENPEGLTAQTANGTAHWKGTGWNQVYNTDCPQCPEGPTWPGGRATRTGE